MERKAERRGASGSAFYEPPSCIKKTSSEIISEARAAVMKTTSSNGPAGPQAPVPAGVPVVRPVNTKRPYTPRDSQRTLFGRAAGPQLSQRPPSAFRYLQNQESLDGVDSALPGKRGTYISPMLGHRETVDPLRGHLPVDVPVPGWARLPSIASLSKLRTGRGQAMGQAMGRATPNFLANLPEELESEDSPGSRAGTAASVGKNTPTRKAYSSPREKTEQLCQPNDAFGPPVLVEESSDNGDVIMFDKNLPGCAIDSILQELVLMSGKGNNDGDVLILIRRLYSALRRNQFGKYANFDESPDDNKGSSARQAKLSKKGKAHILRTLYRFVDRQNDELLLGIARIVLLLKATGNNLAGACKLVFKVSRNDQNDALFMDSNILDLFMEALGRASPLEDAEACVYGYGALKFLTMNVVLLNNLLRLGALDLMVLHLKIVAAARAEGGRIPEQTNHAVFQLTGALRNVAGEERALPLLVSRGAIAALCRTMELFAGDLDLITNIARTLSIVSTSEECCQALVEFPGCVPLMAKLLDKYPGRQDIVVRLGYALGNLLAHSDRSRLLMLESNGAMDSLLTVLALYLEKDLQQTNSPQTNNRNQGNLADQSIGSDGSIEDVIVKMIRIIANMCMNAEVGCLLACNKTADGREVAEQTKNGERTLDLLLTVLERKNIQESGELVLSALSTLNNLSYYPSGDEPSVFQSRLEELSKALKSLLSTNEIECLVETTKVLGNVTRCRMARDILLETGGLEQLLIFLESNNTELLSTTTGVLVNIMADKDKREAFQRTDGVERLVSVLQRAEGDWPLASLVCQVLWNFCVDAVHIDEWLGPTHTNTLLETLVDYLDEERQFEEGDDTSANFQQWEEFAVIAADFVEKIESFLEKSHTDPNNPWPRNTNATGVLEDVSSNLS